MPPRPEGVDIIIPVYGAAELLRACLESVGAETDLTRHRLLIIVDGPQERAVEDVLRGRDVLRNDTRLGFVGSVNRGMASSARDVILLNSDTVVTTRWVEKLIDAACSRGDIGTVTPLSNHATLCSVPRPFEENLLPRGYDARSFAALIERCSAREYPRLPTAVGVCMYIRRALLDDIGFFDAERFGLGYGEENDFCFRALARGWIHVADDATFIGHAGHGSFGTSRKALQKSAAAALRRKHPRYMATIAEFMRRDPLRDVRARITACLRGRDVRTSTRHVVHLVHGWPPFQHAGTELYAYWLVRQQQREHGVAVYARADAPHREHGEAIEYWDEGARVRLVANNFTSRNPVVRNAIADGVLERDFERFLREEKPDLLHVHHLAGHAFSLIAVAKRLGIPVVLQIQDWWFLCGRVNLLDRNGNRCSGPGLMKCAACRTLTNVPMANVPLHFLRRRAARAALRACDAYVAGSEAIRRDYAGMIDPAKPFHVLPYGVDIEPAEANRPPAALPVRFGYVGSIAPHKGVHTAVEAMRGVPNASLHLWGDAAALPDYVRRLQEPAVIFEGRFAEEEKPRVFGAMDVLIVPSIGLESFGLAAREAMACGVPVIATRGGALSEMPAAAFFEAGDAAALRVILQGIVQRPSIIDEWRAALIPPKRTEEHAAEIRRVYEALLSR